MALLLALALALEPGVMQDLEDAKEELSNFESGDLAPLSALVKKAHAAEPAGARLPFESSLLEAPAFDAAALEAGQQKLMHVGATIGQDFAGIQAVSDRLSKLGQAHVAHMAHAKPHAAHKAHAHKAHHMPQHRAHPAHDAAHHDALESLLETQYSHEAREYRSPQMKRKIAAAAEEAKKLMGEITEDWKKSDSNVSPEHPQHPQHQHSQGHASSFLEAPKGKEPVWYVHRKGADFADQERELDADEAHLSHVAARMRTAHTAVAKDLAQAVKNEQIKPHSQYFETLKANFVDKAHPEHMRLHDDDD